MTVHRKGGAASLAAAKRAGPAPCAYGASPRRREELTLTRAALPAAPCRGAAPPPPPPLMPNGGAALATLLPVADAFTEMRPAISIVSGVPLRTFSSGGPGATPTLILDIIAVSAMSVTQNAPASAAAPPSARVRPWAGRHSLAVAIEHAAGALVARRLVPPVHEFLGAGQDGAACSVPPVHSWQRAVSGLTTCHQRRQHCTAWPKVVTIALIDSLPSVSGHPSKTPHYYHCLLASRRAARQCPAAEHQHTFLHWTHAALRARWLPRACGHLNHHSCLAAARPHAAQTHMCLLRTQSIVLLLCEEHAIVPAAASLCQAPCTPTRLHLTIKHK